MGTGHRAHTSKRKVPGLGFYRSSVSEELSEYPVTVAIVKFAPSERKRLGGSFSRVQKQQSGEKWRGRNLKKAADREKVVKRREKHSCSG